MGVSNALSFCVDALNNRTLAMERANRFHDENNHRIVRHMMAHLCLGGLATLDQKPKQVVTQIWLCCAVFPVAVRDRFYPYRDSNSFKNSTSDSTLSGEQAL